ncbi:exosome complex RNA-binding protein Csl4 [Thermogladius sp. KZ2Tp1]|uniref:exosome complex RNA-binding protein Csl4 n=1 Tax=Thermogladius sp. KZ2Tp1 TaxID=3136289 RepID=UPI003DA99CFC
MSSDKVTPGDVLGVLEEFIAGSGVYEDASGRLRSSVVGVVFADKLRKSVSVKPAVAKTLVPRVGDIVEGVVVHMNDDLAFVRIYWVEDKRSVKPVSMTGVIHVSQASQAYVETMFDVVRVSDVVKAKVIGGKGVFQLSIKEPQLGVVYARCNYCGGELVYEGGRLVCSVCGQVNKRKVSTNYVLVKVQ